MAIFERIYVKSLILFSFLWFCFVFSDFLVLFHLALNFVLFDFDYL